MPYPITVEGFLPERDRLSTPQSTLHRNISQRRPHGDPTETGMKDSGQTDSGQISRTRFFIAGIFSGLLLLSHATSHGQFYETAELPKGLVARYSAGDRSIERLEEAISYDWGTSLPDRRLGSADGKFKGQWKSQLLVRQEGKHRIHAFAQGAVSVEINGEVVLKAESRTPGWLSGEDFTPDVGFQSLSVQFEKLADEARLQLFWSSDVFPLEPLPGHLFFREAGRPDLAQIELGRNQFEAFRCGACHKDVLPEAEPLTAPDLTRSVAGLPTDWIVKKLTGHVPGKMPGFELSKEHATAIAAALVDSSENVKLESLPKPGKGRNDNNDRDAGLTLINSLGCLACHSTKPEVASDAAETVVEASLFGGGSLANIGSKRSIEWFNTWLRKPESLNRSHRMPVFDLSSQECRQLALALSSLRADKTGATASELATADQPDELVRQGKQLIHDLGCRSCHVVTAKHHSLPTKLSTRMPSLRF
jgi:hypothetical protein